MFSQPQPVLRAPKPRARTGPDHWNKGVIVVKTGEDNNKTKKQRVMFLYSKTIHRGDGKLVCSDDWRDYQLGEWLEFTTNDQENYYANRKIEPPYPTRRSSRVDNLVQVHVTFCLLPDWISHRRCLSREKLWSPELGMLFTTGKTVRELGLKPNTLYSAWAHWATSHVNFDQSPDAMDSMGWPYEPNVFWEITNGDEQDLKIIPDPNFEKWNALMKQLREEAEDTTRREEELRDADEERVEGLIKAGKLKGAHFPMRRRRAAAQVSGSFGSAAPAHVAGPADHGFGVAASAGVRGAHALPPASGGFGIPVSGRDPSAFGVPARAVARDGAALQDRVSAAHGFGASVSAQTPASAGAPPHRGALGAHGFGTPVSGGFGAPVSTRVFGVTAREDATRRGFGVAAPAQKVDFGFNGSGDDENPKKKDTVTSKIGFGFGRGPVHQKKEDHRLTEKDENAKTLKKKELEATAQFEVVDFDFDRMEKDDKDHFRKEKKK